MYKAFSCKSSCDMTACMNNFKYCCFQPIQELLHWPSSKECAVHFLEFPLGGLLANMHAPMICPELPYTKTVVSVQFHSVPCASVKWKHPRATGHCIEMFFEEIIGFPNSCKIYQMSVVTSYCAVSNRKLIFITFIVHCVLYQRQRISLRCTIRIFHAFWLRSGQCIFVRQKPKLVHLNIWSQNPPSRLPR